MARPGRPVLLEGSKLKNELPEAGDGQSTWTREQLEKMDRRFVAQLERAIARGKERPPCSTF